MVVAVGLTVTAPDVATDPTPLSIVTEVAFDVVHVSVELCPELMLVGLAPKLIVGGGFDVPTVMFADALAGTLPLLSQNWTTT